MMGRKTRTDEKEMRESILVASEVAAHRFSQTRGSVAASAQGNLIAMVTSNFRWRLILRD